MESGSPEGGALPLTDIPSVAAYFTLLGRKKTTTPARGRKIFSLPSNSPANEKLPQLTTVTTLNSCFPPVDFPSKQRSPTNFPLSSVK